MEFNQIIYQIYPLGFCGAPKENDGVLQHRILHVCDWIYSVIFTNGVCVWL